jgi:hypothetical protein
MPDHRVSHDSVLRMRPVVDGLKEYPVIHETGDVRQMIDDVVQRVAELPDRDSPDDWPEAMLVTADELRTILLEEFSRLTNQVSLLTAKLEKSCDNTDRAIEGWKGALAFQPAPSDWQQRLFALRKDVPSRELTAEEEAEHRGWTDAINAVCELFAWQNAVDALPPAPEVKDESAEEQAALRETFDATLRALGLVPTTGRREELARLASTFRLAAPHDVWRCGVIADHSQDCDWPFCGCDPHATKVIGTLQECGMLGGKEMPDAKDAIPPQPDWKPDEESFGAGWLMAFDHAEQPRPDAEVLKRAYQGWLTYLPPNVVEGAIPPVPEGATAQDGE